MSDEEEKVELRDYLALSIALLQTVLLPLLVILVLLVLVVIALRLVG